jgi:hypothetical protein
MKVRCRTLRIVASTLAGAMIAIAIVVGLVEASDGSSRSINQPGGERSENRMRTNESPATTRYVGMWVTLDGHIRHELLPNGRYDEARGARKSAYQGRYEIRGDHIDYWDDTGFTADGKFVSNDELHHGGMIFRRER